MQKTVKVKGVWGIQTVYASRVFSKL